LPDTNVKIDCMTKLAKFTDGDSTKLYANVKLLI